MRGIPRAVVAKGLPTRAHACSRVVALVVRPRHTSTSTSHLLALSHASQWRRCLDSIGDARLVRGRERSATSHRTHCSSAVDSTSFDRSAALLPIDRRTAAVCLGSESRHQTRGCRCRSSVCLMIHACCDCRFTQTNARVLAAVRSQSCLNAIKLSVSSSFSRLYWNPSTRLPPSRTATPSCQITNARVKRMRMVSCRWSTTHHRPSNTIQPIK